jgi:hypothetical protein
MLQQQQQQQQQQQCKGLVKTAAARSASQRALSAGASMLQGKQQRQQCQGLVQAAAEAEKLRAVLMQQH